MLSGEALIAIVNPRERQEMARRTPPRNAKGRFMKRGHSHRARRNPRRSHARRHHARVHTRTRYRTRARVHHRRRRAHRNPRFGIPSTRMIQGQLGGALIGAGGALALDLTLNFGERYLPPALTGGWPRKLLRLGGAFLLGALSGLVVKPETRRAITAGAVTVVTYTIVRDLLNDFVMPDTMKLGDPGEPGSQYPWSWNPYLAGRLSHGGSTSSSDGSMMAGYITGPGRVRSFAMPRVRAGAGVTASGRRLSSYVDDGVTSPGGSGLGADLEI